MEIYLNRLADGLFKHFGPNPALTIVPKKIRVHLRSELSEDSYQALMNMMIVKGFAVEFTDFVFFGGETLMPKRDVITVTDFRARNAP